MEKLKLRLLAAQIEFQWWFIRRERRKGRRLLESGFSHSSQKLLSLNRRFSKHCAKALKTQREYERTAEIIQTTQKIPVKHKELVK